LLADYIILKKYVLVLLLLSTWTYGQFESVGFSGFIHTNDSVTFPYEINITRLGNVINGYSISDKGGTSETKTTFEVKTIRDRIYFKEQEVVYTKADYSTFDDFCLVTFNLNEKELFTAKNLNIDFLGVFTDGASCINGTIQLVSKDFIEKRFAKTEKMMDNSNLVNKKLGDSLEIIKEKINALKNQFIAPNDEISLTKDNVLNFNLEEPYKVYIRDYKLFDGDIIHVKSNDKEGENIKILESETYFEIDVDKKKNTLEIKGIDEGEIPPITAAIIIENASKKVLHKIKLDFKTGEKAIILLNY
jgi:hypothetical protein